MRVEKQKIPSASRTKTNQRMRNYESDVDKARLKLRSLADDRSALFGGAGRYRDYDPSDPSSGTARGSDDLQLQQRQQLLEGTDRLDRTTQRLRASQALANETEAIGASTLAELHRQRDVLGNTRDTLLDSEGYVDRSVKTLKGMGRR